MSLAKTPQPPYYAVIFSSIRREGNQKEYLQMALKMEQLAKEQVGYLGVESAREEVGITVSYWKDLVSIKAWKEQVDHQVAQKMGREKWYKSYITRIALVERDYSFEN